MFMVRRSVFVLLFAFTAGCQRDTERNAIGSKPESSTSAENPTVSPRRLVASATTKDIIHVGNAVVVQSDSSIGRYQAVFEDDGQTYLYAMDTERSDMPIVDALRIYNVESVVERDKPSQLHIIWSADGLKAALFLNSYPHAICNFEESRGCCRTGFPPVAPELSYSHDWDESQMEHFH